MPFLQVSPGADIPGRTKIAERSTIRLRKDAEKRRIKAEKRQRKRELELLEREKEGKLSQLEQKSEELGLDVPYKRTTTRTTAPAFSPLAERIKAEQGYQRLSTAEKTDLLESKIRPALKERGRTEIEEEASVYGITPEELSRFSTVKGKRSYIESVGKVKSAEKATEAKERKETLRSQKLGVDNIKWMRSMVEKPDRDNVFTDPTTGTKYTLNTITEARRKFEEKMDRKATIAEEQMLAEIPWPPDGVDEVAEQKAGPTEETRAGKAKELGLEPTGITGEGVTSFGRPIAPKEPSRQEQAFESVQRGEPLEGYTMAETKKLAGGYIAPETEKGPTFTQQQKIDSLKADLSRGRGSMQTQFGEAQPFEIESMDDALDVISRSNLSPTLFKEELRKWAERDTIRSQIPTLKEKGKVVIRDKDGNLFAIPKSQLKQAKKEGFELVKK